MTKTDFEQDLTGRLQRLADHARTEPVGDPVARPPSRRGPALLVAAAATVLVAAAVAVLLSRSGDDGGRQVHTSPSTTTTTTTLEHIDWPGNEGQWSTLPAGPAGTFPTTIWTGQELVVWGGETVSEQAWTDDGAAYDPTTDTWRVLADSPLAARSEHAAVWTGSEVIICCGRVPDGDGHTAAAYDPAADSWRSIAPPPTDVQFAVAAWTGSEMIVTGGVDDGGVEQLSATWAYDPTSDSWTERAPAPAVIERNAHSAWTGDRLLVLPRFFTAAPPLAYDPAADEWTVLPQPPEGLAVDGGSMVWTGEEMVIWGVSPTVDTEATGGRLSLEDGTWRPLADDSLPPVDWYEGTPGSNAAAWTGDEMVVVAGEVGPDLPDGASAVLAYDPERDTWTRLPVSPSGTRDPLLWTGDVVIVPGDRFHVFDPA